MVINRPTAPVIRVQPKLRFDLIKMQRKKQQQRTEAKKDPSKWGHTKFIQAANKKIPEFFHSFILSVREVVRAAHCVYALASCIALYTEWKLNWIHTKQETHMWTGCVVVMIRVNAGCVVVMATVWGDASGVDLMLKEVNRITAGRRPGERDRITPLYCTQSNHMVPVCSVDSRIISMQLSWICLPKLQPLLGTCCQNDRKIESSSLLLLMKLLQCADLYPVFLGSVQLHASSLILFMACRVWGFLLIQSLVKSVL